MSETAEKALPERLARADFFRSEGRYDEAMRLVNDHLNENFDDPRALFIIGNILIESGKVGLAHTLFKQFLGLKPNVPHAWNNLGRCYHDSAAIEEAERCFRKAYKMEPDNAISCCNLGLVYLYKGDIDRAIEYSEQAIKLSPDYRNAKHNLGLAYLTKREWAKGWENYEASVGSNADRRERVYGDEPRWDGSKGKCVIAYGEQGIGDEISFASIIPDLIRDSRETVIECDKRLEGLFKRSFPQAHVYGTRYKDVIDWADKHRLEGRVSFGSLGKFYRQSDADFDGKPYLVADPERRIQWRALLDSLGPKPKVGIAWQGGINRTGKARRSVTLDALMPVLKQDAIFVSLQYKNAAEEIERLQQERGIKVHHWSRSVENPDYDETAALVAELDCVVSVTTAGIHLAGALGIPCLCLTPLNPMWRYGLKEERMPWYNSVELIRQQKPGQWVEPIAEVAYRLRDFLRAKHDNGRRQPEGGDRLVA